LAEFARGERVDFVVCSGDVTALGTEGEYAAARRALRPFEEFPQGLCIVPGNHDLYLQDVLHDRRFERHFGDLLRSDLPGLCADGAYPFVRLLGDEVAVVGVNSAKPNPNPFISSGQVSGAQLSALEQLLAHEALVSRYVILTTHYGVLKKGGEPDTTRHGLVNAAELLRVCSSKSRLLLAHGHIHHCYAHAKTHERPWLFCAGSVTHEGQEGGWIYEFDGPRARALPLAYRADRYHLGDPEGVAID
jgi:3',5'-cyclic AMP phosphodiesterase CpdA